MTIYLTYGEYMNLSAMEKATSHNAWVIGKSMLPDFQLSFRGNPAGLPTIIQKNMACTPCILWRANEEALKLLDNEFGSSYHKQEVKLIYCGIKIDAVTHVLKSKQLPLCHPDPEVYDLIRRAYIVQGIPVRYLEEAVEGNSV